MRKAAIALLVTISIHSWAQELDPQKMGTGDANPGVENVIHAAIHFKSFERQTSLLGISFGFGDYNKQNYTMPDSGYFGSGSISLPIYFRGERAVAKHLSIAASLAYNVYYYNYSLQASGNGNVFYRPQTDKVRVISPGLELYYHFDKFIHNPNWDVFVGAGMRANYAKHSNYPTSDSLSTTVKGEVTPTARLGARYYINRNAAFFGDLGFDKVSTFSIGFSYRLYGKILSL